MTSRPPSLPLASLCGLQGESRTPILQVHLEAIPFMGYCLFGVIIGYSRVWMSEINAKDFIISYKSSQELHFSFDQ